jgi:hypothetical protein
MAVIERWQSTIDLESADANTSALAIGEATTDVDDLDWRALVRRKAALLGLCDEGVEALVQANAAHD